MNFKYSVSFLPQDRAILRSIYRFARANSVHLYLAGGILRDLLLGRRKLNPDFDFCLKKNAISFGRMLAKKIKCGFVVLDEEHGACRLVKKAKDKIYTFDFTDFRAETLKEDLLHRDFTVNALALELGEAFKKGNLSAALIDYHGGLSDLGRKVIRAVSSRSFKEDPLRILRAFSFASVLNFTIDPETLKIARREKDKLQGVSGERIRDEIFKIFDTDRAYDFLAKMDALKILEVVFPEIKKMRGIGQGPYHHLDVWQHTLETVRQLEILIKEMKNNPDIRGYLDEIISSQRRRYALLGLGAFLHDIGKPKAMRREGRKIRFHGHERIGVGMTKEIARRIKLSGDELACLRNMVLWHLRPGYLADNQIITARAKFRYFRDTGREAVSVLLLSVADQRATKGPLTTKTSRIHHEKVVFALIKEYFRKQKEKKALPLINGDDLINKFKLRPSPLIGKILSRVQELQAIGKIKTKAQALKAARKFLSHNEAPRAKARGFLERNTKAAKLHLYP